MNQLLKGDGFPCVQINDLAALEMVGDTRQSGARGLGHLGAGTTKDRKQNDAQSGETQMAQWFTSLPPAAVVQDDDVGS
jgi:hypothetical protein